MLFFKSDHFLLKMTQRDILNENYSLWKNYKNIANDSNTGPMGVATVESRIDVGPGKFGFIPD